MSTRVFVVYHLSQSPTCLPTLIILNIPAGGLPAWEQLVWVLRSNMDILIAQRLPPMLVKCLFKQVRTPFVTSLAP
jgi:hypothetical protein